MQPRELKADQFSRYPRKGRQFAVDHLALLRRLPQGLVQSLLAEIIVYDWKFPAERQDLEDHLSYLSSLSDNDLRRSMQDFSRLNISSRLVKMDWPRSPAQFIEALSAELWATRQMDAFRAAADDFESRVRESIPKSSPPVSRLGIVIIGRDVGETVYSVFRKLRPHGTYFDNLRTEDGLHHLIDLFLARASKQPIPYAHWYIEGGNQPISVNREGITTVCYGSLEGPRKALLRKMQEAMNSAAMGPEALRSMLAQMIPADIGLGASEDEAILDHFQVSVLTEGSGTQIFSTTFTQWAAREAMRRAQPLTLLARFAPRQEQRTLNELLAQDHGDVALDVGGSLVDADMGSYYTWINQRRLTGAETSSFLAWFENHKEAVAIGPSFPSGSVSSSSLSLRELVVSII